MYKLEAGRTESDVCATAVWKRVISTFFITFFMIIVAVVVAAVLNVVAVLVK